MEWRMWTVGDVKNRKMQVVMYWHKSYNMIYIYMYHIYITKKNQGILKIGIGFSGLVSSYVLIHSMNEECG